MLLHISFFYLFLSYFRILIKRKRIKLPIGQYNICLRLTNFVSSKSDRRFLKKLIISYKSFSWHNPLVPCFRLMTTRTRDSSSTATLSSHLSRLAGAGPASSSSRPTTLPPPTCPSGCRAPIVWRIKIF